MSKKVTCKDFLILQAIPQKGTISTTEIIAILHNKGFEITPRTVQRDLNGLAEFFEIQSDNNADVPGWFWKKNATKIELPTMNIDTALGVKIIQNFLQDALPTTITNELTSYTSAADTILRGTRKSSSYVQKKIGTISRRMTFVPPKVKPAILEVVYQAVLNNKQVQMRYTLDEQETEEYILHPQGLVVVDEMIYVIGSVWDDDDLMQFSVHNFQNAQLLEEDCTVFDGFDVNTYIENGSFVFSKNKDTTPVSLQINEEVAEYVIQSKLSAEQELTHLHDEVYMLQADVQINEQFKQWILSMGDAVEVVKPQSLQQDIALTIRKSYRKYYS